MGKWMLTVWILWAMISAAAGSVDGAEVAFDRAKLILSVPELWNMSEETATLSLPDSACILHFVLLQSRELREARREARDIWKKEFGTVDFTKREEAQINGIKMTFFYGGVEGRKLDFNELYVLTPAFRLLCIYYAIPRDNKKIGNQIRSFIDNIKPQE